ncbi:hypothetical protein LXL04_008465 [Taraxacum kok-saghyz]
MRLSPEATTQMIIIPALVLKFGNFKNNIISTSKDYPKAKIFHDILNPMTPPLLGVEGDGQGNASIVTSASTMESIFQKSPGLTERNYFGLSNCSSVDSSAVSGIPEVKRNNLNLKAIELRPGLPGSQSPERDTEIDLTNSDSLDVKPLFPLLPSKDGICSSSPKLIVSGNKRGFSDTIEGNWMFVSSIIDSDSSKLQGKGTTTATQSSMIKDTTTSKQLQL